MSIPVLLSIIAIDMSAASLLWQVVSWKRSGPVVTVTAVQALVTVDMSGQWFTSVTARNTGRSPITVTGWEFRMPGGGSVVSTRTVRWSTPLPYRLEAGAEGTWFMVTDGVQETCAKRGARYQDLRAS
ncbi:hypothetical protein [Plantactinospora sp. CA-290183]|uniref:hypothetical protein n=1 Tax=Plantactinospora sp. CA-290183 TaxID=3240006 RepID=UPI003D910F60